MILIAAFSVAIRAQTDTPLVPASPIVRATIHADDLSIDIRSLLNLIRATDATDARISFRDGLLLHIRPESKVDESVEVRPDPTLLIITVDAKRDMQLNNEKQGNLSDTSPLVKRLRDLFKTREATGFFRENKNEIEKTVWLRLDRDLKVGDLARLGMAVQLAGSDQVGLWLDERSPLDPPEPGEWIDPQLPLPKPKALPKQKPKPKPRTRKPN